MAAGFSVLHVLEAPLLPFTSGFMAENVNPLRGCPLPVSAVMECDLILTAARNPIL